MVQGFFPLWLPDAGSPRKIPAQLLISLCVGLMVTQTERYVDPKLAGAVHSRANVNSGEGEGLYA